MTEVEQGWEYEEDEQFALTELLIPLALSRLEGTFRDSDALDTKALGTLALDAAAIALLITTHQAITASGGFRPLASSLRLAFS